MALFSASDFTGPFRVTVPFWLITFTLWASVESDLSSMMERRMFLVRSRSDVILLLIGCGLVRVAILFVDLFVLSGLTPESVFCAPQEARTK